MTAPNAFLIFLLAFSAVTGWLMLREPAATSMASPTNSTSTDTKVQKNEVAPTNQTSVTTSEQQDPLLSRLINTSLPVFELNHVTLGEAIDSLQLRATELTPNTTVTKSLSFSFSNEESTTINKPITLYAEDISLADALTLICEKAQCNWVINDDQVLIITE